MSATPKSANPVAFVEMAAPQPCADWETPPTNEELDVVKDFFTCNYPFRYPDGSKPSDHVSPVLGPEMVKAIEKANEVIQSGRWRDKGRNVKEDPAPEPSLIELCEIALATRLKKCSGETGMMSSALTDAQAALVLAQTLEILKKGKDLKSCPVCLWQPGVANNLMMRLSTMVKVQPYVKTCKKCSVQKSIGEFRKSGDRQKQKV